ncbi:uncharacterized protein LOC129224729 [Uloborus diversus]|uniref:uncharacterized protein LOC129224729 n=1 Tax=Uloborus diversus TaxID=327109 RepID=UPI00240A3702|nr:uncharacterized protein LOC129224729 [Uloborus diversus]
MASLKHVGCFLVVVLCIYAISPTHGQGMRRKQPKDKGEAMYTCLNHQCCTCDKSQEMQDCFEEMEETTMRYFIGEVEKCFELDYTIANSDAATAACVLPKEGWDRCRNQILDNFNNYINEMYTSDDPEKKNEIPGVERAKVCFGPHISACQTFPNQCL